MTDDADPAGAVRRAVGRGGLAVAGAVTVALLVAVFYFPVGIVLAESVTAGGRLSLDGFGAVLADPFYFGVLADVFADPLAVGRHLGAVAGWVARVVDPLDPGFWWGLGVSVLTFPLDVGAYAGPVKGWTGLFGFTAYQALASTLLSLAVGLPGAYVLSRFEFPGRATLRSLTVLPFVLPGIMVAVGFRAVVGADGTLNGLLGLVGAGPVELLGTLEVVLVAHAFYNAPLVMRVTTAAWEAVDRRSVETARSLGAGPRRAFRDVVVPQLLPAVLTGALLTFVFTFMTFPIVLALGGLELATVEVWVFDRASQLRIPEAATLAVLETVVTLGLTYAYLRYERRIAGAGGAATGADREPLFEGLGSLLSVRRVAVLAYGVVAFALFLAPLASMALASVTDSSGVTLEHWAFLFERQVGGTAAQTKPLPAIGNSLAFAAGTLLVAVPMGVTVAALTTDRGPDSGSRWHTGAEALALLPLAVSGVVLGVGLLRGLVFGVPIPWTDLRLRVVGPVAVVLAHAVAAYPFVVRTVGPQLADVDRSMVESARALGASRTRALLDVELPLVAAGLLAGAAFAVAISFGEFDSTVILAQGSDAYTMPVAVERFLGRRSGPAMAMGTVLLAVVSASFLVVERVGGRFGGL
jgi:thiamine transport system permease protein